ncbi:MAG: hypothetical protein M1813_006964 [Trichoglossum hirsutum]|nr:MAG: hypothetical protein M1813_006964 [Trichoglossum hirsutum]
MSFSASRLVLRRSQFMLSRQAAHSNSTTTQATRATSTTTSRASEAASSASSKASQGLSRVSSSAGPAISGAAKGIGKALGRIGGRTGRFITFVESMIPPTIYYARVGLELSKLVFQGQKMSPPPLSTFQQYFQSLIHVIRNPTSLFASTTTTTNTLSPSSMLNLLRNANGQQLAATGVVIAEVIGFFTIGEILGRFKLVGYRGEKLEHH